MSQVRIQTGAGQTVPIVLGELDGVQLGLKAAEYLSLTLLVGAGIFEVAVLGQPVASRPRGILRAGAGLGFVLLALASVGDVIHTDVLMMRTMDAAGIGDYFQHTHLGRATCLRLGLAALFLGDAWTDRFRRGETATSLFAGLGLAVLATFTAVSHAEQTHAWLPRSMDLCHLVGMVTWSGLLLYFSFLNIGSHRSSAGEAAAMLPRLSQVSLASVGLLSSTGIYAAWLHVPSWAALWGTDYGRSLLVKVAAIAAMLLLAGINRWRLMPHLAEPSAVGSLAVLVRIEALLMLAVLALTAVLTTRDLPDGGAGTVPAVVVEVAVDSI